MERPTLQSATVAAEAASSVFRYVYANGWESEGAAHANLKGFYRFSVSCYSGRPLIKESRPALGQEGLRVHKGPSRPPSGSSPSTICVFSQLTPYPGGLPPVLCRISAAKMTHS